MRETIMNIGFAKPPKKVLDERELVRIYSSTDSLSIPMRENIDTAPLQVQSLFPEFRDQSLSTGSTLTGPKFRLNYSFLAKIEYLKDFGDNQVEFQNRKERKNYKQIKEPIWESLDKRTFLTVAGEELLCRLKMVVVEELGIKVAEPFKHLPVYDSYFILKPPVTRINVQLLQEPEEIETQGLQEPESLVDSIDSEVQQIFENQISFLRHLKRTLEQEELDLIDERSDLINRRLEITSNPDNYVEENSLRNIRGEKPLRPTAQIQVDLINGRIEEIRIRRQEIARELADPKFDVLSYYDSTI